MCLKSHRDYWLLAALGVFPGLFWLATYIVTGSQGSWGTDFHAFYNAARQFLTGTPSLYDSGMLKTYLSRADSQQIGWPFPYPPSLGLLIWPLGFFSYDVAFWLWTIFGIGIFAWAQALALRLWLSDWDTKALLLLSFVLSACSPFALANIIAGQSGHVFAAFLLLALSQAALRPYLAAAALALLSMKPQIAALAALLLLLIGETRVLWRGLIWGGVLVAVSAGIWGTALWVEYASFIQQFSGTLSLKPQALQALTVSAYSTLRLFNISPMIAMLCYGAFAGGVFYTLLRLRHLVPYAALLAGGVLLLPYVMWHDVVFLNVAVVWLLAVSRVTGFLPGERLGLVAVLLLPPMCLLQWNAQHFNVSVLILVLLHVLVLRRAIRRQS